MWGESTGDRWISHKRSIMWTIDVFFVVNLNNPLNKQSRYRWFQTTWHPYDVTLITCKPPVAPDSYAVAISHICYQLVNCFKRLIQIKWKLAVKTEFFYFKFASFSFRWPQDVAIGAMGSPSRRPSGTKVTPEVSGYQRAYHSGADTWVHWTGLWNSRCSIREGSQPWFQVEKSVGLYVNPSKSCLQNVGHFIQGPPLLTWV